MKSEKDKTARKREKRAIDMRNALARKRDGTSITLCIFGGDCVWTKPSQSVFTSNQQQQHTHTQNDAHISSYIAWSEQHMKYIKYDSLAYTPKKSIRTKYSSMPQTTRINKCKTNIKNILYTALAWAPTAIHTAIQRIGKNSHYITLGGVNSDTQRERRKERIEWKQNQQK